MMNLLPNRSTFSKTNLPLFFILAGLVLFNPGRSQNVTFNATQACHGKATALIGNTPLGDTAISAWKWDLDNDGQYDDATGKFIYNTFSSPGTFTVNLQVILSAGGNDSVSNPVVVHPVPDVNFHVDNLCEGKAAVYIDQSVISSGSIVQYLWDFNNDGVVDDNSGKQVSYTCGPASVYVTRLECVSDKGCKAFTTKTTQVFSQPVASFSSMYNCMGDSTLLVNSSTITNETIALNIWDFGDGATGILSQGNVFHKYASAQAYTVRLVVVSANNCRDTTWQNIMINPKPSVTISLDGDSILFSGASRTLTASGSPANYSWSDGSAGSSITVTQSGLYTVTATDANGCIQSASVTITAREIPEVNVSGDILTPNGDNINDYLVIGSIDAYSKCSITIYNIWGDKIFEAAEYKNDWAGTYNGSPLDGGTYYYIIKCEGQEQKAGSVNILR